MNTTNQLTIIPQAAELVRQSTDIAGLCREIVVASAVQIGPKKYVPVEAWQAIATAHGCVAGARDVKKVDGGFSATGEIRRMQDGTLLATAEGFVGEDEPVWFGGGLNPKTGKPYVARAEYACRAMAQTRAISRACRSAFAHVVVLMNAGLSTTPAEEVPAEGFDHVPAPAPAAPRTVPTRQAAPPQRPAASGVSAVTVTGVKEKHGESARGPWTLFIVNFSDGTEATTFDAQLGELAQRLADSDESCIPVLKPGKKEGKLDLVDIKQSTPSAPEPRAMLSPEGEADLATAENNIPF